MTTPDSTSAVCWMRVPTRVTGAMKPVSGTGTISTGMPERAQSTRLRTPSSVQRSGEVGQQVKRAGGRAASASAVPRTVSRSSRMTAKPSIVKAPVTTALPQYSRLMNRR